MYFLADKGGPPGTDISRSGSLTNSLSTNLLADETLLLVLGPFFAVTCAQSDYISIVYASVI